jgi:NAD(P)H-hydrate epimerase
MLPVLTPSEMAAVDAAAPEPVTVLIERAGAAVAREALRMLGGGYGRRVVVLAGKGNNGADGRAAAARLGRRGVHVELVDALDAPASLPGCDLVIDAAYGTGFHGDFDAPDAGGAPVLAVDIPSGVDGVTGQPAGRVLAAARTVTFAALKPGLLLAPGRALAGQIVLTDIGLDVSRATVGVVEAADVASWLPTRAATSHKWKAAVLVIAGSPGMTGAARLAARAAQRAGAGMVRVGSPGIDDDRGRPVEATGLELPGDGWADLVLEAAARFGALVVGPGLGRSDAARDGVRRLVADVAVPLVIDGDGLAALGRDAPTLLRGRHEATTTERGRPASVAASGSDDAGRVNVATVLTPHDGEFEQLTGHPPGADRLDAARSLAAATGAIVLLKGPTTVIADPSGTVRIVTAGDARLATAGTGDVLSGIIGALLARGVAPLDAAASAAWLHARAAALGPAEGLVAGDLPDRLPDVFAALRSVSGPERARQGMDVPGPYSGGAGG